MMNVRLLKFPYAAGLAALLLALPLLYRSASAQPSGQGAAPPADSAVTTTLAAQSDLAITVYNSNLALARDVRQLNLTPGEPRLWFMDIAASIYPAALHSRPLAGRTLLGVLVQPYEDDLRDPHERLRKLVARQV